MRGRKSCSREPMRTMTVMLRYRGELLGFAAATRFYLIPQVEQLPDDHPLVRMATLMALFAKQIRDGEVEGPYTDARAELYCRCALIPDEEFAEVDTGDFTDEVLAGHFGVPTEQVALKREDVRP